MKSIKRKIDLNTHKKVLIDLHSTLIHVNNDIQLKAHDTYLIIKTLTHYIHNEHLLFVK